MTKYKKETIFCGYIMEMKVKLYRATQNKHYMVILRGYINSDTIKECTLWRY